MEAELKHEMALLDTLISEASTLLLSPYEVTQRLNALAEDLFAKRLLVEIEQHGQKYRWGWLEQPPPQTVLRKGALSSAVSFEVRGDRYPETGYEQSFLSKFADLAKALWGNDIRSMGGPNWKPEAVQAKLVPSVERLRTASAESPAVAVLYGDLDHFKNLNDQAGHERGNDAIRLVNRELHDLCLRHGGLPFHPSGDEFYLILPDKGLLPMMKALFELRRRIKVHQFNDKSGQGHTVDLTLGLKFFHEPVSVDLLDRALIDAEEATKAPSQGSMDDANGSNPQERKSIEADKSGSKKDKRRGKLSIFGSGCAAATPIDPIEFGELAALMARRNTLTAPAVFRDPRLGMVQSAVYNFKRNSRQVFDEHLLDVQTWLDIEATPACTVESILLETAPKAIPKIALAAAVASGILQARNDADDGGSIDIRVRFSKDGKQVSVVDGGTLAWGDQLSRDAEEVSEVEIEVADSARQACVLVGVQVGFQDHLTLAGGSHLPHELFDQVVIVDDRPNTGGGLPDFWQAALAQVCEVAASGPDLIYVFAWGKTSANSETVLRLQGAREWPEDEIAHLANVPSKKVRDLQPQLRDNTKLVCDATSVVSALYDIAPVVHLAPKPNSSAELPEAGSLKREMLTLQPLQATDGLRCRSAAQAYPIIIDTLRKAQTRPSSDDAHQPLRELVAFKLTLETPTLFTVPTYLRKQEEDMRRYAEDVLLSESGRIRAGLASNNQMSAFKKELLACFTAGEVPRSTRRACLVVPHIPTADGNPSPAGLVSVWASPRMNDSAERTVDWVFVWRTVEAFIGLPYSLYGSIAIAHSLLDQVTKEQPNETSTPFRIGELTYIALSLHMRSDGVHRRIAKRIVDESSE